MRFDIGWLDRLFGKKVEIQLPGPDGVRSVWVTKAWLAQMQAEGRIATSAKAHVLVHILDPGGVARAELGLGGPATTYRTETWTIGEDIQPPQVAKFRAPDSDDLYALVTYEAGRSRNFLVARDLWMKAKRDMGV